MVIENKNTTFTLILHIQIAHLLLFSFEQSVNATTYRHVNHMDTSIFQAHLYKCSRDTHLLADVSCIAYKTNRHSSIATVKQWSRPQVAGSTPTVGLGYLNSHLTFLALNLNQQDIYLENHLIH